jgi:hypothetical protein
MKKVLFIIFSSFIVSLSSCQKSKDPCETAALPPIPLSPDFILVDKNTGEELYKVLSLDKHISGSQPCNDNKLSVLNEIAKNPGDSIYHNYFSFSNVRLNVGYETNSCHTIYMTINGTDIDTLEFTGYTTVTEDPCYKHYKFNVEKLKYNGAEVAPTIVTGAAPYPKYYILRK